MILLDTNVVSEPLRADGDKAVLRWLDDQDIETLYLSAISLAELRYGVAALPDGKREECFILGLRVGSSPCSAPVSCSSIQRN